MSHPRSTVRIAAVGDLHCTATSRAWIHPLLTQINQAADLLALCGDLTHTGRAEDATILAEELASTVKLPMLAVLGNHDFESGQQDEIRRIMTDAKVCVLDGQATEVCGLGFAGVKGFGGGFHGKMLIRWGEPLIKQFAQEAIDEARKLDRALGQLTTPQRIAILHYAPIRATVIGESPEIFAFVGSSHLETPLNRHRVAAAFHGHAHHGSPEGRTSTGIPVYNVSEPLMRRSPPHHLFRIVEVAVAAAPTATRQTPQGIKG